MGGIWFITLWLLVHGDHDEYKNEEAHKVHHEVVAYRALVDVLISEVALLQKQHYEILFQRSRKGMETGPLLHPRIRKYKPLYNLELPFKPFWEDP